MLHSPSAYRLSLRASFVAGIFSRERVFKGAEFLFLDTFKYHLHMHSLVTSMCFQAVARFDRALQLGVGPLDGVKLSKKSDRNYFCPCSVKYW